MPKVDIALVRPEMLIWARETAGMSREDVAKKLKMPIERVANWEKGNLTPTIRQAHQLAKIYNQPFAAFYLPKPPEKKYPKVPDYRVFSNKKSKTLSSGLILEINKASERREIALELYEENNEVPKKFDLQINLNSSPEMMGQLVRENLKINFITQKTWKKTEIAFSKWRELIEDLGVLVFQTENNQISVKEVRGFSISKKTLPIIVVNRKDSNAAKIFTMLHELTHLMLRSSGICDPISLYQKEKEKADLVEVYCNKVAAEILIPKKEFLAEKVVRRIRGNGPWRDEDISQLATTFNSSYEAILRRLLTFKLISPVLYKKKIKTYKDKFATSSPKQSGRRAVISPVVKSIATHGKHYARLVSEAYYFNRITSHDCANYLGLKARRIREVRERIGGG